jgi:hypothetical protein
MMIALPLDDEPAPPQLIEHAAQLVHVEVKQSTGQACRSYHKLTQFSRASVGM